MKPTGSNPVCEAFLSDAAKLDQRSAPLVLAPSVRSGFPIVVEDDGGQLGRKVTIHAEAGTTRGKRS